MLARCTGYIQSEEKGASLELRDACLKCGLSKRAHEIVNEVEEAMKKSNNVALYYTVGLNLHFVASDLNINKLTPDKVIAQKWLENLRTANTRYKLYRVEIRQIEEPQLIKKKETI